MDNEDIDPTDILNSVTEQLVTSFANIKHTAEQSLLIQDYLESYETDAVLKPVKQMQADFGKDLDWFNVVNPLTFEQLRGKLVILDFFTYCCINCMHVIPDLKALEAQFSVEQGLVVVGVHSPKFENEKDSTNIAAASQRYGIKHPVVNDAHSQLWKSLHIRCWPTLFVLSPLGEPLLLLMGEGHRAFLEVFVAAALKYYAGKQQLKNFSIATPSTNGSAPAAHLKFPAKIARLEFAKEELYAVADAGNNRILVFDRQGKVQHRIGGCEAGFADGSFETARFNAPQGVAFVTPDVLVVADTENHAIRQLTLSSEQVQTLAGTGKQGHDRIGGRAGTSQSISSPWDVAVFKTRDMDMTFHTDERQVHEKTVILIAMAGTHQIWGYFPEGAIWWKFKKYEPLTCVSLIGNGSEENRNNSYPQNAAFAQPSGLAMAKQLLFIADSESSSVRKASLLDGKVSAVVGGERNPLNLFAFGDVDGKQYNAKLQHPLGLAYNHLTEKLYVADTYNHKIKFIDTDENSVESLRIKNAQTGAALKFNEPAGLCCDASGRQLFVSDTNNHCLQLVNLQTLTAQRFELNFEKLNAKLASTQVAATGGGTVRLRLHKRLPLSKLNRLQLFVQVTPTEQLKFTADAPQKVQLQEAGHFAPVAGESASGLLQAGQYKLHLQRTFDDTVDAAGHEEEIRLEFMLNLCDEASCMSRRFSVILENCSLEEASVDVTDGSAVELLQLGISKNNIFLR